MKNQQSGSASLWVLLAALLVAATASEAQPAGGKMSGPQFDAAMAKLFGEHKAFSATMEFQTDAGPSGKPLTMHGNFAYLNGMSRFEMDLTQMQSPDMPPQALAQMKQMGMDKVVTISIPDTKIMRMIYPSMNSYVEMPIPDSSAAATASDFKVEISELGAESVGGHQCVKNKAVLTGPDGAAHEWTVWNASDLDKFPVKLEAAQDGKHVTMLFKDVKFEKPDAAQFNPPTGYKKYDNVMGLMMSRVGAGQGPP